MKNDAISNNVKIHKKLLIHLRVTEVLSFGRNIGLQQTRQQTAKAENSLIFGKNACVSARWFESCLELDNIAGFTATFTKMIIPKSSTCVQNMVIITGSKM